MRVVQFVKDGDRRVGTVVEDAIRDLTSVESSWQRTVDVFAASVRSDRTLSDVINEAAASSSCVAIPYDDVHSGCPQADSCHLLPPVDTPDPHNVLVSGTGLTHTGSMESRDEMHAEAEGTTDSARIFAWGVKGGRPQGDDRGVAPEWFWKGNGTVLRGHNDCLDLPAFAEDGGEEPELVGCYIVDPTGQPRRLGFALGNEWSDHATEKKNYLYLAPSKLRTCAVGPELITDFDFQQLELRCTVQRDGSTVYDSGTLLSGERAMCHSLRNIEDHHFKYPQHRQPGDVHLHYFGTSKLSYGSRTWQYQQGDLIEVDAGGFSRPLRNRVVVSDREAAEPIRVSPA